MSGQRNLRAGPAYEKEIIEKIDASRLFPPLFRTAETKPQLDRDKCDIMDKEERFPYVIQAKNTTAKAQYPKLLEEVRTRHIDKIPVILHKYNRNVNDRFLVKGRFAILDQDDFLDIIIRLERYKKAYMEISCYWDSISDEEQIKLNERLKELGL